MIELLVHDEASAADAVSGCVHIHGPADVEVSLTPAAALETAARIGNAAVDALLTAALASCKGHLLPTPV